MIAVSAGSADAGMILLAGEMDQAMAIVKPSLMSNVRRRV